MGGRREKGGGSLSSLHSFHRSHYSYFSEGRPSVRPRLSSRRKMQIEIAAGLEPSTTAKAAYGRTEREGRGFFTPFAYRDNPKKLPLGCVILSPCRLSGRARARVHATQDKHLWAFMYRADAAQVLCYMTKSACPRLRGYRADRLRRPET